MNTRIGKRQKRISPRRGLSYIAEINREGSPQGRIKWSLAGQRGRNAHNLSAPTSKGMIKTEHHKATVALYRIEGLRQGVVVRVLETASTKGLVAIVHSLESDGLGARFTKI